MTNPSSRALPPPKQIRFVNNQGQPPSKRRRINAAYVPNLLLLLVFLLFSCWEIWFVAAACRNYRPVCGVVSVKCGVGQFSVADSEAARWREDCILKLCQMLDLPQEENPMCG